MRTSWSRMRRGALGVTFALTCASSVQLSGCLQSSARALTSDIADEAGRSALQAEQKIAGRKKEAAAKAHDPVLPPSSEGVELAGGAVDIQQEIELVQGEQKPKFENPLRKLLKRKPAQAIEGDPFLDETRNTAGTAKLPSQASGDAPDAFEQLLAERKQRGELTPPQKGEKKSAAAIDDAIWENLLKQHLKEELAQPAATLDVAETGARFDQTGENPFAAAKVSALPFPGWSEGETEKSLPALESLVSGERTQPAATDGTSNEVADESDNWWSAHPADSAKTSRQPKSSTLGDPFAASTVASSETPVEAEAPTVTDSLECRKQRLRMQALISDCHTQILRGDLHAAYRSALLADQIVQEHHLKFEPGQETPHMLAREIADRIWKDSGKAAAEASPVSGSGDEPSDDERAVPAASEHDRIFARITPQARWQPAGSMPANLSQSMTPDRVMSSEQGQPLADLPQIRPIRSQAETRPVPSEAVDADPPASRSSSVTEAPLPFPQSVAIADSAGDDEKPVLKAPALPLDSGVTFAIAETVAESDDVSQIAAERVAEKQPAVFPAEAPMVSEPPSLAQHEGPLLLAQSPGSMTRPSEEGLMAGFEDFVIESAASEVASAPAPSVSKAGRSLQWGVLGFIAAILSTIIGLRLGRGLPQPPATADQSADDEQQKQPQLRIRRAA